MRKAEIIMLSIFFLFACVKPLIAQDDYHNLKAHRKEPPCAKYGGCRKKIFWSTPETKEFTFVDGSTIGVNRVTDEVMYYGYRTSARFPSFRYPNKDKDFDKGSPISGKHWMRVTDPQMKERLKKLYLEQRAGGGGHTGMP